MSISAPDCPLYIPISQVSEILAAMGKVAFSDPFGNWPKLPVVDGLRSDRGRPLALFPPISFSVIEAHRGYHQALQLFTPKGYD
jgi:hypothetical protein